MTDWAKALGKAVRELRLQRGLSQHALAEAAGLDRNYVSPFELGKGNPKFSTVVALAGALEVSVVELFERAETCSRGERP